MDILNIILPHNKIKKCTNWEANQYLTKIFEMICIKIGVNLFQPVLSFNRYLFITIFVSHSYIASFIYMLFSDVSISAKLEALCIAFVTYQAIHKMYSGVYNLKFYYNLFQTVRNLHMRYMDNLVVAPVLKQVCVYCAYFVECFGILVIAVILVFTIIPVFMWTVYGELIPILPVQFPFIDWHTPIGYTINLVHHLALCIIGAPGILAADSMFMYFVIHTLGYFEILKDRSDKLNTLLEPNEPESLQKIQQQLYECIQAHQEFISYIESVDERHTQFSMAQVITSVMILTLSLFLTVWDKWVIGPFMAMAGLVQLLEYCVLGTIVTIQNDKVSDLIYGIYWYLLPVREQKLICLMILRAQSPAELNVGSFAKLNVETGMTVLKTIYQYLMMLLEFLS